MPVYFLGTLAHSNKSVDYAGLVAAFTAPIIAVGYDWTEVDDNDGGLLDECLARVFARLTESFAAACIMITAVVVVLPQSASSLVHQDMIRSLRGLRISVQQVRGGVTGGDQESMLKI